MREMLTIPSMDVGIFIHFSELLGYHVSTLNTDEHKSEIEHYINTFTQTVNMIRKENHMLACFVSMAMINSFKESIEDSIEINVLDDSIRAKLKQLFTFSDQYENREKYAPSKSIAHEAKYYSGSKYLGEAAIISAIPDEKYIHEELGYKRYIDQWRGLYYSIIDRHVIQLTALCISLGALFFYIRIFFKKKKSTYPNLKLSLGVMTLVYVLLSIIIPLVLYSLLFIINEYGSRGWSVEFNTPHMVLEVISLIFTIVMLPLYIISVKVSKRCEDIGIDPERLSKLAKLTLIVLATCWLYIFVSKLNYLPYENMWDSWQNIVATILSSSLICLLLYRVCSTFVRMFKKKQDCTHMVTLARAKICLFVSNQLMKIHESSRLSQLLHNESGERVVWFRAEHEVCEYFKGRFDEIFLEE